MQILMDKRPEPKSAVWQAKGPKRKPGRPPKHRLLEAELAEGDGFAELVYTPRKRPAVRRKACSQQIDLPLLRV